MMGILGPKQPSLFAYEADLELRIPADHPLRQVKKSLDLSFVEPMVQHSYGRCGHQSLPPQIIMRMMFLLFFYNIPSERELCQQISLRLDFLWFLDLELDSPVPNHSVLSKARARWGPEIFEQLFVRTVQQCVEAGLVDGKLLHIDSTIVAANAAKDSVIHGSAEWIAALREAYQEQERKLQDLPAPCLVPTQAMPELALDVAPSATTERALDSTPGPVVPKPLATPSVSLETTPLSEAGAKKAAVNDTHLSTTDPDAHLARDKSGVTRLSYKEHRVVDDAHGVITALELTSSSTPDGAQLPGLYQKHQSHTQLDIPRPSIAGDKHYGTASNYRYCLQAGLRAHLGEAVNGVEGRGLFGPQRFLYEAEQDRFRCPAGQVLLLHQRRPEQNTNTYIIERAELCQHCALRPQCTRSKNGRTLQVPEDYLTIQQARAEANSPAARRSRRRRRHVMEGSFADAMNNHGAKRARWRRSWRQQIQSWMIAAVQNVRILIKRAPRPWGAAAAVVKLIGPLEVPLKLARVEPSAWFLASALPHLSLILAPSKATGPRQLTEQSV